MSENLLPVDLRCTHVRLQALLDDAREHDLSPDQLRSVLQELGTALEELRLAEEALTTQSEQLAASAQAIDEERERYAELFEFAPDAYVETDDMGKILEANRAAADLFAVAASHLRGKLVISFVAPTERRRFRRLVAEAARGAAVAEEVVHLHTRDERDLVVGVAIARTDHPTLGSTQLRWLLRDITARLELEEQVGDLEDEVDLLTRAAEVQAVATGDDPLAATLRGLVAVAERVLPGCQVGLSLAGRSDMQRALSTGARAAELDAVQRAAGTGPCIVALQRSEVVRARPSDWPILAEATDVVEIVGIPLLQGAEIAGALNVYAFERPLDEHAMRLLDLVARQASVALQNAALVAAGVNLAGGLTRALETRGIIERAKGILMAEGDIDDDAAFAMLRTASQRENVKLHQIAQRVVDRRIAHDD